MLSWLTGAEKHAFQLRVPCGAAVDMPGQPAEVPYCQTRPDDEASDSDSDAGDLARPIPLLERKGPLRGAEGKLLPRHRARDGRSASADETMRELHRSLEDTMMACET